MRRSRVLTFAITFACSLHAASASAAPRAGIFQDLSSPIAIVGFDPSARAAGMGGAGGAVFWGDDASPWGNPALLGLVSGLHYDDSRTSVLPHDVIPFVARRAILGYGGLGLSLSGQPFDGLGKSELTQTLGDVSGLPESGTFERMRSWGVGASLAGVLTSTARLRQAAAPNFARFADLAFGYSEKVVESGTTGGVTAQARGVSRDLGLLARTGTTMSRGGGDAMPLRLDAACGLSLLGSGDGHAGRSPIERRFRSAFAARGSLGRAAGWCRSLPAWLSPAFDSMVSLGLAYDAEHVTHRGSLGGYDLHHYGAELGVTSVVALQLGRFESATHHAATTWGYSVALPAGTFGGVRYTRATVPMDPGIDSERLPHRTWSVWLDPVAIAGRGR